MRIHISKKNNKINLLFSGSLDLTRGVFQAIESMYFLPENYVLNISGVGSKSSVYLVQKKLMNLILLEIKWYAGI